jgi:hypothetical protein
MLAACADTSTAPRQPLASSGVTNQLAPLPLLCTAQVHAATVSCVPQKTPTGVLAQRTPGSKRFDLIIGGQHTYVTLTSSNVAYDGTTSDFSFDVTVTNLIQQPLGTSDGVTADANGVRVFLTGDPAVTAGTGSATVANATGLGVFTGSNQPYFQYAPEIPAGTFAAGILGMNETSQPLTWHFTIDPTVVSFTFTAYVSAPVEFPTGYIDSMPRLLTLNPNEAFVINPASHSAVGTLVTDTFTYVSSLPALFSGTSDGTITAGSSNGAGILTVSSATRPGVDTTAVSVCPSVTLVDSSAVVDSITTHDCFAAMNPDSDIFLPRTNHYGKLYRVALTAGQTITVVMGDTLTNFDTFLVLSDRLGNVVADNDDDNLHLIGLGSRIIYTATKSGVYVIQATTFHPFDTGAYGLDVFIQ